MLVTRVTLTNLSHTLFARTIYKRGTFVEVYSYDYIPQSVIFGALAFATNRVLKKPLSIVDKIHLTSAPPRCGCGKDTFFQEPEKPVCDEHGYVTVSHSMLVHSVPLDPYCWQPKMISFKGEFTEHRRMSPRKFYALTPDQEFSFLTYVEDEESKDCFMEALRVLCSEVNDEKGIGLGIGWGKKFWGLFKAKTTGWGSLEPLAKGNVISRLQSPFTTPNGETYLAQNVQPLNVIVGNTIVRNIHHRKERSIVSVYVEGSEVIALEEINYYPTDNPDWLMGFTSKIFNRRVGGAQVKAIEPSFLAHKKLRKEGVVS